MNQVSIQAAIYQALSTLSYPVYDDVPQNAEFPYIVIGDDTSIPFDDDCNVGAESTITIHVWSTYPGRKEVKQIMDSVYNRLHRQNLPIAGGYSITLNAEYQDSFLDPDGTTRHGVIRFRLLTRSNKHG
jgi:hypothetical protein